MRTSPTMDSVPHPSRGIMAVPLWKPQDLENMWHDSLTWIEIWLGSHLQPDLQLGKIQKSRAFYFIAWRDWPKSIPLQKVIGLARHRPSHACHWLNHDKFIVSTCLGHGVSRCLVKHCCGCQDGCLWELFELNKRPTWGKDISFPSVTELVQSTAFLTITKQTVVFHKWQCYPASGNRLGLEFCHQLSLLSSLVREICILLSPQYHLIQFFPTMKESLLLVLCLG